MSRAPDFLLREGPLNPSDAAVALIVVDRTQYLLQLRDDKSGIFYPGHWGLFGGAIDSGETLEQGLRRELLEELGFAPREAAYFTEFTFDFAPHRGERVRRRYFEVQVTADEAANMELGEGADLRVWDAKDLLRQEPVTPYDAMAIWMHATRSEYDGRPRRAP